MNINPEWAATSLDEESNTGASEVQNCGKPVYALANDLAKGHGGDAALNALFGAALAIAWQYGAKADALAAYMRAIADDIPKVYALYDRDNSATKPN